jgi:hypothetical protein
VCVCVLLYVYRCGQADRIITQRAVGTDLIMNDTDCPVNIPGYTHHGNCNLLCAPASWTDVLSFFVGNYVAHAATVIALPGQSLAETIKNILIALVFPSAGVLRAIQTISTMAFRQHTELRKAAKAGALCTIVKVSEFKKRPRKLTLANIIPGFGLLEKQVNAMFGIKEPAQTDVAEDGATDLQPQAEARPIVAEKVHGLHRLPKGYKLVVLYPYAQFESDLEVQEGNFITKMFKRPPRPQIKLASTYNLLKIVISLGQLLYGISTLYQVQGDQVERYGYAAFGLTITPYAWMSLLNLVGNCVAPQYSTKFLVSSKTLDELKDEIKRQDLKDDFRFEGVVGRISPETEEAVKEGRTHPLMTPTFDRAGLYYILALFASMVPIIIIGAISRFNAGSSAVYQRAWTLAWLVCGIITGPALYLFELASNATTSWVIIIWSAALYSVPAIGGFVVVSEMIGNYGICSRIP